MVCALGAVGCGRRPAEPARRVLPLAQVSGTLPLAGVTRPVRVVRDRWGVPHIYAQNPTDLFFAQGFVQAEDRLFQMDLWRRSVQGRLSEVLGPNFVERDAMTRRVQYRGDLTTEWASYGPDVGAIALAFVRGINAYVAIALRNPPEEFTLAGWRPELWRAEDLLNRTDAFLASGDGELEAFRARLVAAIGARRADAIFPAASAYRPPPGIDLGAMGAVVGDALRRVGTAPFFSGLAAPALTGSNAWAAPAARSATGRPLVANDPHRPFAHPSLRYLIHLNAPGWNVIGAASPWLPGVVMGHNDRVAWGMTAFPADTEDVYVEHVHPSNPHQVERRGRFVDTTIVKDPIIIKGQAKPFEFERELTSHGVIVASDRANHLAFTVRWSGSEPGAAGELAAVTIDRARSGAGLRAALTHWKMPVVDVVFADVDGTIGRQVAGLVPARTAGNGWDGKLPAPGWTGTFEWTGWRGPTDLPHGMSPPGTAGANVLFSANENPARLNRLGEIFASKSSKFGVDDFKHLQRDTASWNAEQLVPLLAPLRADREPVEAARRELLGWDRRVAADSQTATLYVFWEQALLGKLVEARIGPVLLGDYIAHARLDVAALTTPTRTWFDGDPTKGRDRLLVEALATALDRVRTLTRPDRPPAWGRLHTLMFRHPLAVTEATRRRLNVGPFEQAGDANTIMSSYPGEDVSGGASFREVLDVANWDRSVATNPPGQSGSPGSRHFSDLAKPWADGEYLTLAFTDQAVAAAAESTLILEPSGRQ